MGAGEGNKKIKPGDPESDRPSGERTRCWDAGLGKVSKPHDGSSPSQEQMRGGLEQREQGFGRRHGGYLRAAGTLKA